MQKGTKYWDGKESLSYEYDDGGRSAAGFKGKGGDCVCRSVAIASGLNYREVYDILAAGNKKQRQTKASGRNSGRRTALHGIHVRRKWFRDYMASLGFVWTPTMQVGSGCKVHLLSGELPAGRLVVQLSGHYTAVIDGVIRDTYNPTRNTIVSDENGKRISHRCVYGYWKLT